MFTSFFRVWALSSQVQVADKVQDLVQDMVQDPVPGWAVGRRAGASTHQGSRSQPTQRPSTSCPTGARTLPPLLPKEELLAAAEPATTVAAGSGSAGQVYREQDGAARPSSVPSLVSTVWRPNG